MTVWFKGSWVWLVSAAFAVAENPVSCVIDLSARRQVIEHFGANDAWSFQKIGGWSEAQKSRIADLLYSTEKGIGLSFARFYVGGGINLKTIRDPWRTADTFETGEGKYDWNRLANERWFLRAAKARGVQHFGMTIYSPPVRLTRNGLTNHGTDKTSTTNLKPGVEDSFARYLTDLLVHFRNHPDPAERIEFDRIFPLNEPQWEWSAGQEGNRASNADMLRIYASAIRSIKAAGLRTRLGGPESGSIAGMLGLNKDARTKWSADYGNYLNLLSTNPTIAEGLAGVMTYHSYWSDKVPGDLVPQREQLAKAVAATPGWRLWQSEYCIMEKGRDLGIQSALRVARVIHSDLTVANATSWQWWLAVANEDYKSGLIYTDFKKPGDAENILESKILWALGNYSRFIRPGMSRVDVRGAPQNLNGLMVSAYLDQPNRRVVVVCVNFGDQPADLRANLANGNRVSTAPLRSIPYTTSATENLAPGTPQDLTTGTRIPPKSVVTFVSQS